jgi:hypothetical protein
MLSLVYQALKKRLSEVTTPDYVDWYMGQYLEADAEDGGQLLWGTPAQFIEFLPVQWQTLGNNVQAANTKFNIHLVNDCYHDDDKRITDAALGHLVQEAAVYAALQNWRCLMSYVPGLEALADTPNDRVLIESITRESTDPDHNMGRQIVSVQGFACRIYDYGAVKNWVEVLATLQETVIKVDHL